MSIRPRRPGVCPALWFGVVLAVWAAGARAQSPGETLPLPLPPGASGVSTDDLLRRLQRSEELNQKLLEKVERLSQQVEGLTKTVGSKVDAGDESSGMAGQGGFKEPPETRPREGRPRETVAQAGVRASGVLALPNAQGEGNRFLGKIPLLGHLDYDRDGVGFETRDQEFLLKFRGELQADAITFLNPSGGQSLHGGFYLPRTRFYFQGHFTKPIDYQLSFQRSYTSFGFLNVFINFNYDERFKFRIGRFKSPFTYEWYKLNNWRRITPERSLFAANFGLNRMIGAMLWGEFLESKVEYAAAIMDGPRNSDQDFNREKDAIGMINIRPFLDRADSPLQNLNIGGSVDYGNQNNPMTGALRTNVNYSNEGVLGDDPLVNATVPFLQFNQGTYERGLRNLWELHLAYFYQGLSLMAAWEAGYESYARPPMRSVPVPLDGFFVEASYFLTGETLSERTVIDPVRRFDLRPGKFGLGAFEPFARFSYLNIGNEIFTYGISDPNLWTNRVQLVDVGMNWYLNKGLKIYIDWQHGLFGDPVAYRRGGWTTNYNMLWVRFQLYY